MTEAPTLHTHDTAGTPERLLAAAGQVFARKGYAQATVREICRLAGANVAAVNYHFGGKEGLYRALLERVYEARAPRLPPDDSPGRTAEERLRAMVRSALEGILDDRRPAWDDTLLYREIVEPSTVLPEVVQRSIGPRSRALKAIVAELLGIAPQEARSHPAVARAVLSVIGQCLHYHFARQVIPLLFPELPVGPAALDALAEHVATFSLGGIRSLRQAMEADRA